MTSSRGDLDGPGVPLSHYLIEHPSAQVRFTCQGCLAFHDAPTWAVARRLRSRGLGDEGTGIRQVGRLSRRPCPRCGSVRWETTPAFRPIAGR